MKQLPRSYGKAAYIVLTLYAVVGGMFLPSSPEDALYYFPRLLFGQGFLLLGYSAFSEMPLGLLFLAMLIFELFLLWVGASDSKHPSRNVLRYLLIAVCIADIVLCMHNPTQAYAPILHPNLKNLYIILEIALDALFAGIVFMQTFPKERSHEI